MQVKELMTHVPICLKETDTLRTVIHCMLDTKGATLPVVDEAGRLTGVFTRTMLYRLLLADCPLDTPITGHVKREVTWILESTPFEETVKLVQTSHVGTGIVVDEEHRVRGLFTKKDMISYLLRTTARLREKLDTAGRQVAHVRPPTGNHHPVRYTWDDIITRDPLMERLKRTARQAAKGSSTIMLRGDSGTGKELFAHAIHASSARGHGPLVTVNCAAIPESLLESEFFGYAPGAFTGAERRGKPGKLELASGGTLFLDEIGDMSPRLQVKLLRVLEEKAFYRVGGTERIEVDVRIIAATNRPLERLVADGAFREDLFYRLNVISLDIPPLRNRPGDILPLAEHFIHEFNRQLGTNITGIAPQARAILERYRWPGNVRELRNVLERAMAFADTALIQPADLPASMLGPMEASPSTRFPSPPAPSQPHTLTTARRESEREVLAQALAQANGNKSRAARALGISRSTLYEKLKTYGMG